MFIIAKQFLMDFVNVAKLKGKYSLDIKSLSRFSDSEALVEGSWRTYKAVLETFVNVNVNECPLLQRHLPGTEELTLEPQPMQGRCRRTLGAPCWSDRGPAAWHRGLQGTHGVGTAGWKTLPEMK